MQHLVLGFNVGTTSSLLCCMQAYSLKVTYKTKTSKKTGGMMLNGNNLRYLYFRGFKCAFEDEMMP